MVKAFDIPAVPAISDNFNLQSSRRISKLIQLLSVSVLPRRAASLISPFVQFHAT